MLIQSIRVQLLRDPRMYILYVYPSDSMLILSIQHLGMGVTVLLVDLKVKGRTFYIYSAHGEFPLFRRQLGARHCSRK